MPILYINVRYTKDRFGVVPRWMLDKLIASKEILQFYRYSEKRWVTVGVDMTRGWGGEYKGTERRTPFAA